MPNWITFKNSKDFLTRISKTFEWRIYNFSKNYLKNGVLGPSSPLEHPKWEGGWDSKNCIAYFWLFMWLEFKIPANKDNIHIYVTVFKFPTFQISIKNSIRGYIISHKHFAREIYTEIRAANLIRFIFGSYLTCITQPRLGKPNLHLNEWVGLQTG